MSTFKYLITANQDGPFAFQCLRFTLPYGNSFTILRDQTPLDPKNLNQWLPS